MDEWIMINRSITHHWLWYDAEWLKCWLDLLLMASTEDHKVMSDGYTFMLRKGQILASLQFFVDRWHKSKPTVIKFMKKLESENMIRRETLFRRTAVMTIINYEQFLQPTAPVMPPRSPKMTRPMVVKQLPKTTEEVNNDKVDNFKTEMSSDNYWCEVMAMRYHISSEVLRQKIDEFFIDQTCRGKLSHADLRDAKSHFNNWLLVQQRIEKEKQNGTANKERLQGQRRGVEATLNPAEAYKTSF